MATKRLIAFTLSFVFVTSVALGAANPKDSPTTDSAKQTLQIGDDAEVSEVQEELYRITGDEWVLRDQVEDDQDQAPGEGDYSVPANGLTTACLMTIDGQMAFQTVAQGKFSAFGWCSDTDPNPNTACLLQCCPPPPTLCRIPACPTFESVIRDECVWEDFWAAHSFAIGTPPPAIDFDEWVVIAVVLGERNLCTYSVEITSIRMTDCGVKVTVRECVQAPTNARTVNPYHFVKIRKSCLPCRKAVCFDHGGLVPILTDAAP